MANKVTENKATSVKGTANNVGQEIVKQAPTTEVVNCTMTEEEHKARVERITTKMEQGLKLSWDIIVDITSAKERNEQELDGYTSSAEDFNKWANDLFGMGDTQIKQAVRLVQFYGSIDDKGEYTLEDKYKRYTKEKLDIIQRLLNVKKLTKAGFDETVNALGIMPSTSEGILKEMVKQAKGIEDKGATEDGEKDTKKKTTKSEVEQELEFVKADIARFERLHNVESKAIGDITLLLNNEKVNDKDFRNKVRDIIYAMGKEEKTEDKNTKNENK